MPITEMTPDALTAAEASVSPDQPIFMVNLLRYHGRARYGASADFPPCSGREAYFQRYVPAFSEIAESAGIKPFWIGNVAAAIVAPSEEQWDDVAVVEYPSFKAFRDLVDSDTYKAKADPHRAAALANWRLIATNKMDLP